MLSEFSNNKRGWAGLSCACACVVAWAGATRSVLEMDTIYVCREGLTPRKFLVFLLSSFVEFGLKQNSFIELNIER